MAQVNEIALKELEEKIFRAAVERVFEETATDPSQSDPQKAEIALWDRASETDFNGEQW